MWSGKYVSVYVVCNSPASKLISQRFVYIKMGSKLRVYTDNMKFVNGGLYCGKKGVSEKSL